MILFMVRDPAVLEALLQPFVTKCLLQQREGHDDGSSQSLLIDLHRARIGAFRIDSGLSLHLTFRSDTSLTSKVLEAVLIHQRIRMQKFDISKKVDLT